MDAPVFVEVSCQVCGSRAASLACRRELETATVGRIEQRLVHCIACGLLFSNPRPTRAAMAAERAATWETEPSDADRRRRAHAAFLQRCAATLPAGRMLDLLCGQGDLLAALDLESWERVGLEPLRPAAEVARARGIDVVETTLEENPLAAGSFDLVSADGVLAGVHDLREAVFAIDWLLRPGGLAVLHVPDLTRPRAGIPSWISFERLSHFSPHTLERLCAEFGLHAVTSERSDGPGLLMALRKGELEPTESPLEIPLDRAETAERLERYLREQEALEAGVRRRFEGLRERWQEERIRVALHGSGEEARFLLDLVDLGDQVTAILDPDPARQGQRFLRWTVRAPAEAPEIGVDAIVLTTPPGHGRDQVALSTLEASHGIELVRFLAPDRASAA